MGAPGSGKGTNTVFILESRGLTRSVTMSSLLQSDPRIAAAMAAGELVPDELVADALLETVFDPDTDPAGVLVDGFPRTALQVDLLKLLHDKVEEKHEFYAAAAAAKANEAVAKGAAAKDAFSFGDPDSAEARWPRPSFKVVVLYVDQAESVRRQLARARLAATHNARVLDAGAGQLVDVRATDVDEALCRRRYAVFKRHYSTVLRLRRWFVFSLIDSGGSLDATRAQILRELRYQSSLDLDEGTYAAIRHLPLAAELAREARQRLVQQLDGHKRRHEALFERVVDLISGEVVPLLRSSALAGFAEYTSRRGDELLESPLAQQMLIDVLTDRGFGVAHSEVEKVVPVRVDLSTGRIEVSRERKQVFRVTFERGSSVVRGADAAAGGASAAAAAASAAPSPAAAPAAGTGAAAAAASLGGGGGGGALGSTTVVPRHLDHSQSLDDAEARWARRRRGGVSGEGSSSSSSSDARPLQQYRLHPPPPRFSPERRPEHHPEDDDGDEEGGRQAAASSRE